MMVALTREAWRVSQERIAGLSAREVAPKNTGVSCDAVTTINASRRLTRQPLVDYSSPKRAKLAPNLRKKQ